MDSKNILTEDLGNGNFRQTETTGMPACESRQVCTDATRPDASTFLPGKFLGRYFCWISRRARAEAVLQATITMPQFSFRNK